MPSIWPSWNCAKNGFCSKFEHVQQLLRPLLNLFGHCLHLCIYMGMQIWAVPYIYAVYVPYTYMGPYTWNPYVATLTICI
jgi:hypothetical protein